MEAAAKSLVRVAQRLEEAASANPEDADELQGRATGLRDRASGMRLGIDLYKAYPFQQRLAIEKKGKPSLAAALFAVGQHIESQAKDMLAGRPNPDNWGYTEQGEASIQQGYALCSMHPTHVLVVWLRTCS
jgi:hypothetical protein